MSTTEEDEPVYPTQLKSVSCGGERGSEEIIFYDPVAMADNGETSAWIKVNAELLIEIGEVESQ